MSWDGPDDMIDYAPDEIYSPPMGATGVVGASAAVTATVSYFVNGLPGPSDLWVAALITTFVFWLWKAAQGFWKRRIAKHRLVLRFEAATGVEVFDELPDIGG